MLKNLILGLLLALLATTIVWAQPSELADFPGEGHRPGWHRGPGDRLQQLVEYLDLSEAQEVEWNAIVERHFDAVEARHRKLGELRDSFRQLADQESPDLTALGQAALDLHREMESIRASRQQLIEELAVVLTPEQLERFEAFQAAREFSAPRDRRERPRRGGPDRD